MSYQISIDKDDETGTWNAALLEETDFGLTIGDPITTGTGNTAREAVGDLDWHHAWTRHLIAKDER